MATHSLKFMVYATPTPQGSKNAAVRGGKAVMWEASGGRLVDWRRAVKDAASAAATEHGAFTTQPLKVYLTFWMPQPKTNKRKAATTKPDLDKLVRSTLDSITLAGVWIDDCQVVEITAIKCWADRDNQIGYAEILISEIEAYL
jgi:crossover junction endodeoxyribonuclease RusA